MVKNQKGFTLIEMLIVLLIISVLIIITIPNVTKHFASIDQKGCDALITMVQGQVEAYKIDMNHYPTSIDQLELKDGQTECPDGRILKIDTNGVVRAEEDNSNDGTGEPTGQDT